MNQTSVPSTPIAATSPTLMKSVSGRNVKPTLPMLPRKVYRQLDEAQEKMRKLPKDEQLATGVELLVVIYEIAEMLEAIQLEIRSMLELRTRAED